MGKTQAYDAALARLTRYVESRDAIALRGMDDIIHAVHTGTKWEAELRLSDLRVIAADAADAARVIDELRKLRVEMHDLVQMCRAASTRKNRR